MLSLFKEFVESVMYKQLVRVRCPLCVSVVCRACYGRVRCLSCRVQRPGLGLLSGEAARRTQRRCKRAGLAPISSLDALCVYKNSHTGRTICGCPV
eukprot:2708263-Prymnesium_polylepis.1